MPGEHCCEEGGVRDEPFPGQTDWEWTVKNKEEDVQGKWKTHRWDRSAVPEILGALEMGKLLPGGVKCHITAWVIWKPYSIWGLPQDSVDYEKIAQ